MCVYGGWGWALSLLPFLLSENTREREDSRTEETSAKCVSHSVMSDSLWPQGLQPARLLCPCDSTGKDTGVGFHALFQGSSQPRDRGQVSCIAGGFFTIWVTREALPQPGKPSAKLAPKSSRETGRDSVEVQGNSGASASGTLSGSWWSIWSPGRL